MGSASNAAGSSNNPRSFGSIMRKMNRNRDARLPEWCACGARPVLRWSATDSNPGRPFVGCPNYNTAGKRWCGLFLWVDKILEEDAVTCDGRTSSSNDNEEWKMNIAWKLGRLESEVRVLKMGGIFLFTCMLLLLVTVVVLVLRLDRQQSQLYVAKN
ncbi:Zinc finger GRF-type protein [Arachis hypogaea]|nr:Zinc finger GRF-type protein [Arachis hypogaea]